MRSYLLLTFACFALNSQCLTIGKSTEVVHDHAEKDKESSLPGGQYFQITEDCDMSYIPAMDKFDMAKFSGIWYELAKTTAWHIDVSDGMWKIFTYNNSSESYRFLFSGRNADNKCIRPMPGIIKPTIENPGEISFKYRTYLTYVSETFRVLHTDYDSYAVLYMCVKVNEKARRCYPGGSFGSIWTRKSHVQHDIFDTAAKVLQKACMDVSILKISPKISPCNVEKLGIRDEDTIPAPSKCYHAVKPGTCDGQIKKYYYNENDGQCHEFEFTGCGGNPNNFPTKNDCENTCTDMSSNEPVCRKTSICALACPPCCREVSGGCVECSCETIVIDPPFVECVHNENECPVECEAEQKYEGCFACICEENEYPEPKNERSPRCNEVQEKGKCSARYERFYFSMRTKQCEKFTYTGCGGNQNNFESLELCQKDCNNGLGALQNISQANPMDDYDPDGASKMSSAFTCFLCVVLSLLWLR